MRIINTLLFVSFFIVLGGCINVVEFPEVEEVPIKQVTKFRTFNPSNASLVMNGTEYKYDYIINKMYWVGPPARSVVEDKRTIYLLRKYDGEDLQLYIIYNGLDWLYLDKAYNSHKEVSLNIISRYVLPNDNFAEHVAININIEDAIMIATTMEYYVLQLSGKEGALEIIVPGAYFRGFLNAMEK